MEEITKRRLEVLNDTINHYNLNNRSNKGYDCTYSPAHEGSEGCAVGRLIKDKELCKTLDIRPDDGNGSCVKWIFDKLPEDVKFLGKNFLRDLQNLHDNILNWTETGLSNTGAEEVKIIRKKFLLDLDI